MRRQSWQKADIFKSIFYHHAKRRRRCIVYNVLYIYKEHYTLLISHFVDVIIRLAHVYMEKQREERFYLTFF